MVSYARKGEFERKHAGCLNLWLEAVLQTVVLRAKELDVTLIPFCEGCRARGVSDTITSCIAQTPIIIIDSAVYPSVRVSTLMIRLGIAIEIARNRPSIVMHPFQSGMRSGVRMVSINQSLSQSSSRTCQNVGFGCRVAYRDYFGPIQLIHMNIGAISDDA